MGWFADLMVVLVCAAFVCLVYTAGYQHGLRVSRRIIDNMSKLNAVDKELHKRGVNPS
jgi:hypothetical protein